MKKFFCFLGFLILVSNSLFGAQKPIKVSLLTFDTAPQPHALFGHSALRVQNPNNISDKDIIYNYGMFDFNAPNFVLKFIKGNLDYRLGKESFKRSMKMYDLWNRQVWEQELLLTQLQAKELITHLETSYLPENRYYRYRFLSRNCSTEIRDLLLCNSFITADYTPLPTQRSYRDFLNTYTKTTPWTKFGINLALGSTIDKKINSYELMFLPDFLSRELEKVTIDKQPLLTPKEKLLPPQPDFEVIATPIPLLVFSFLFVLLVWFPIPTLTNLFFSLIGLAGVVILSIQLLSQHPEVHWNYNLLFCNPLYLIYIFIIRKNKVHLKILFASIFNLSIIAIWGIWYAQIQGFEWSFVLISLSLFWLNCKQFHNENFITK